MAEEVIKIKEGLPGLPGPQGAQGEQGIQGIQGEQGIQGDAADLPNIIVFEATKDGSEDVSALLEAAIDTASLEGSVLWVPPGDYLLENTVEPDMSRIPSIRVLDPLNTNFIVDDAISTAFLFDCRDNAVGPFDVSAMEEAVLIHSYDNVSRITLATPAEAANFAKWDVVHLATDARPAFDLTDRMCGETFKVKFVDEVNGYLYVWGRLRFTDRYNDLTNGFSNAQVRKISGSFSFESPSFKPLVNPDTDISNRPDFIRVIAASGGVISNMRVTEPYATSVEIYSSYNIAIKESTIEKGTNNITHTRPLIPYLVNYYGACNSCWLSNPIISEMRHGPTSDGNSSLDVWDENDWWQLGQPVDCGGSGGRVTNASGAPLDSHEEGDNIQYINWVINNCLRGDEEGGIVGYIGQARARSTLFKDIIANYCNNGFTFKPEDNGSVPCEVVIDNVTARYSTYSYDEGDFLTISGPTTPFDVSPVAKVMNSYIYRYGQPLDVDNGNVDVYFINSIIDQPVREGFEIDGGKLVIENCSLYLDTPASVTNRALQAIRLGGDCEVDIQGLNIKLGEDVAASLIYVTDSSTAIDLVAKNISVDPNGETLPNFISTADVDKFSSIECDENIQIRIVDVTTDYTYEVWDELVLVDSSSLPRTVTLPPVKGLLFRVKKTDAVNDVTVAASTGTIDGNVLTTQNEVGVWKFDGTNFHKVN